MSKTAVVILNWNGIALLERYLPSVIKHSPSATIYLADNASTDESVEYVTENFPQIKIIQNPANDGFAKGYNLALKQVDADIFCLLNSDVQVTEGWLDHVVRFMEQTPEAAIVQPKILDLMRQDHFEYAGAAGGFLDRLGYPFCRGRIFQAIEKDRGQYDDTREIFWATGACMFIRKDTFWKLGGFDEDYFAHQEEIDFCWRARNQGYKVFYVGLSRVYHLGGSTLSNMNPRKTYLNFRNSLFSITKNLPGKRVMLVILARLLLDMVAAVRFLAQGKGRHSLAIIQAHFGYYKMLRKMYKKRQKAKFILNYYLTTSIVWLHFVHHVKNFNNLVKD